MSRGALTSLSVSGIVSAILALSCLGSTAKAADLTWGGLYRVEAVKIEGSELGGTTSDKAYFLHHLTLTPKIIAADGLTIYSRFDLFNNPTWGANQQLGEFLGRGVGTTTPTNESNSNVLSRSGAAGDLAVTTLYASWVQEFGQLVVGRAPVQFGLVLAFNAGNGMFDHHIDTRDLVGYKVVLGNFFLMPMIAKVNEGNLGEEDDVNDYIIHLQYDNPETELSLGLLYDIRVSTFAGNDMPSGTAAGGNIGDATPNTTFPARADGGKSTLIGLYASEKVSSFTISLEADLLSGDTGLKTANNLGVGLNAFGIAADIKWEPADSKTKGGLKVGIASGDDPGTEDTYEGFAFSRNYDVAMLMFNHPLGQRDFLRTGLVRPMKDAAGNSIKASNQPDTEAISNVIYVAPSLQHQWKENLSFGGTLVYGMLNKDPLPGASTASNLGFELDLNLTYKPYDRLTWVTEAGFLFPGEAWKGGNNAFENKFAYGVITKAAISF